MTRDQQVYTLYLTWAETEAEATTTTAHMVRAVCPCVELEQAAKVVAWLCIGTYTMHLYVTCEIKNKHDVAT